MIEEAGEKFVPEGADKFEAPKPDEKPKEKSAATEKIMTNGEKLGLTLEEIGIPEKEKIPQTPEQRGRNWLGGMKEKLKEIVSGDLGLYTKAFLTCAVGSGLFTGFLKITGISPTELPAFIAWGVTMGGVVLGVAFLESRHKEREYLKRQAKNQEQKN